MAPRQRSSNEAGEAPRPKTAKEDRMSEEIKLEFPEFRNWLPTTDMHLLDVTNKAIIVLSVKNNLKSEELLKLLCLVFGHHDRSTRKNKNSFETSDISKAMISRRMGDHQCIRKDGDRFILCVEPRRGPSDITIARIVEVLMTDGNPDNKTFPWNHIIDLVMSALLYRKTGATFFTEKRPFQGKKINKWLLIQKALALVEEVEDDISGEEPPRTLVPQELQNLPIDLRSVRPVKQEVIKVEEDQVAARAARRKRRSEALTNGVAQAAIKKEHLDNAEAGSSLAQNGGAVDQAGPSTSATAVSQPNGPSVIPRSYYGSYKGQNAKEFCESILAEYGPAQTIAMVERSFPEPREESIRQWIEYLRALVPGQE